LKEEKEIEFVNHAKERGRIKVNPGAMCFTYCQIPIIYQLSNKANIKVDFKNGHSTELKSLELDKELSAKIFQRSPDISAIKVSITKNELIPF